MKKSQQHNQSKTNVKSAQITQQSAARTGARTKAKTKIRSFAPSVALTTSRHFGVLSCFSHLAAKSTSARHFRANSYVPLLLALRPRAGSLVSPDRSTRSGRSGRSGRSDKLGKLMISATSLVFCLVFSLFGLVVFPEFASATSITLTIPSSALSVQVSPGKFVKSDKQEISVSTDSAYGYTLKLSSKHGNTLNNTKSSSGVTSKINPISSELTETAFSASSENNIWGFKPSKLRSEDNSDEVNGKFIPAPDNEEGIVLDTTATSNAGGEATNYNITLGVKVDSTLPSGTYANTFTFTAIANELEYSITYDGSAEDVDAGTLPQVQSGSTSSANVTLDSKVPTRAGYVFQGWCTKEPIVDASGTRDDCNAASGTKYDAGANNFPTTKASPTTTLYAMWNELLLTDVFQATTTETTFKVGTGIEMIMVADNQTRQFNPPEVQTATTTKWWPYYAIENTPVTMKVDSPTTPAEVKYLVTVVPKKNYKFTYWQKNDAGTEWTAVGEAATTTTAYKPMSELTQAECQAAGESGMNVTDTRNNVSYTVGIVSNGSDFSRCWMYSNLRLEGGTPLTPDDSDVSGNTSVAEAVMATEWVDWWSKKEMIECKGGVGNDIKPFESYGGNDKDRFCLDNQNTVTEFYYNWFAAIANDAVGDPPTDAGSYEEGSTGHASLDNQTKGSICPRGWRLLEEGVAGDKQLINGCDEIDTFAAAQGANQEEWTGRLAAPGHFWAGQQHHVGMYNYWWSASRFNDAWGRTLAFDHGVAYLVDSNKRDGESVRCILRDQ